MPKAVSKKSVKSALESRVIALSEAAMALNSSFNLDEILAINLTYILMVNRADRGTIYLVDHDKKEIWSKVITGEGIKEIRLPIGTGLAGYVAETGEEIIINDAYQDSRFNPENDKRTGYHTKTMMVLPMQNNQGKLIGVLQVINKLTGQFTQEDLEFSRVLGGLGAVAIDNAILYEKSIASERVKKELEIAERIQNQLIPKKLPDHQSYEFYIKYQSCTEVGGDYVDVIPLANDTFALVIADVSGHGIAAGLLVSNLQASLGAYLESGFPIEKLAKKLNSIIYKRSTPDTYITFTIGILDTNSHTITFVNAGHPETFIVNSSMDRSLKSTGVPLGMMADWDYELNSEPINKGDLLFFYTDGLPETMNAAEEEYGEDRLKDLLYNLKHMDCESLTEHIWNELNTYMGRANAEDDRTVLLVRRKWR